MKRSLLFKALIVGVIVTAGSGGIYWWRERAAASSTDRTGVTAVQKSDIIQRVTIAGTIQPQRRTLVTPPYNGYIGKLFTRVGETVKKGDPLVTIVQSLQSSEAVFPLRAPFTGVVVNINKAEGEYIRETDDKAAIMRIDDLSQLYVEAMAPEIDRGKVRPNQEVLIKASAVPTRSYKGTIESVAYAAALKEPYGRSQVEFPLKIKILDQDEELRPGMSVLIDIIVNKREKVLTLRHEFIEKDANEFFVVMKGGERRPIKVGIQNEQMFEVVQGLTEGEEVRQVDFAALAKQAGRL